MCMGVGACACAQACVYACGGRVCEGVCVCTCAWVSACSVCARGLVQAAPGRLPRDRAKQAAAEVTALLWKPGAQVQFPAVPLKGWVTLGKSPARGRRERWADARGRRAIALSKRRKQHRPLACSRRIPRQARTGAVAVNKATKRHLRSAPAAPRAAWGAGRSFRRPVPLRTSRPFLQRRGSRRPGSRRRCPDSRGPSRMPLALPQAAQGW